MDYRKGKCSKCGAEYKVPASFAHDVARCKVCSGVVHLEPAAGGAGAPSEAVPARKVEKKPAPAGPVAVAAADAERKRQERGTLARLKAQRTDAGKADTGKVTAAPRPKPTARPQPAAARTGRTSRRSKDGDGGGARRGRRGGAREKREKHEKKKGMPIGGMIGLAAIALIVIGGGLYFGGFLGGGEEETTNEVAAAEPEAPVDVAPDEDLEPVPEETAPEEEAPAEEAAPEPEKRVVDPSEVDLTVIEDFGPARGTTDEQWTEMNELMATFMDLSAGAAGPRAGRKLQDMGRLAMPVLINHFKTLDFSAEEGVRKGDMIQRTMKEICNGSNFDYRYETTPEEHYFNKKVVELWAKTWSQVVTDVEAWIRLAKLEDKDPDEAKRLREEYGEGAPVPDPVTSDDLDVD